MVSSVRSPENQTVTFIELFFDLVFVFSVTQIVYLISHNFTWVGVFQGFLIFWLVWWSWTQLTWALNAANTEHTIIQLATLVLSIIGFMMVIFIPETFEGYALRFAIPYVLIRIIGLGIYFMVGRENKNQTRAIRKFALGSSVGLIMTLAGGFLGGNLQYVFWTGVIVLDVLAALFAARDDSWDVHADHFTERHGLFIIIALGESLIVTASLTTGLKFDINLILLSFLAVVIICEFWWIYFHQTKPILDKTFEKLDGRIQSEYARDVYSFLHLFVISGIVSYAIGIELLLGHPEDPVSLKTKSAFTAGFLLYFGGLILTGIRAIRKLSQNKTLLTILLPIIFILSPITDPLIVLSFFALMNLIILIIIQSDLKNLLEQV